jgi:hypothetical protein
MTSVNTGEVMFDLANQYSIEAHYHDLLREAEHERKIKLADKARRDDKRERAADHNGSKKSRKTR